jgi:sulfopyruvate decarboxylase alpha subunit
MTNLNGQAAGEGDEQSPWAPIIFDALKSASVQQVTYVPDAGHTRLIALCSASPDMETMVLTTEEEGIAVAAGAWLGGQRSAMLMQSSGVGNCVNMFSLLASCRIPFLTVVTMRGEYQEFNPWQVPMGRATVPALEIMGVRAIRVEVLDELDEQVRSATTMAFEGDQAIAILLSQRLLGAKKWVK